MECEIERCAHPIRVPALIKLSVLPDISQYPLLSLTSWIFSRFRKIFADSDRQALIAISMLFATEVVVKGYDGGTNTMNAQIWLKGVA
jgi:hypothetical protein